MHECDVHQLLPTVQGVDQCQTAPVGCLTALLSHCQLYGVALPAKDHVCISVMYMQLLLTVKELDKCQTALLWTPWLSHCQLYGVLLPAKDHVCMSVLYMQLLLTVHEFDKCQSALLDLLTASMPGCRTVSSMELRFLQRTMCI